MSNSINTNIAAYYAQQNITTATNASTENVARLSSGNAIVEASDNVAALAVGTSIGTQVSVLQSAQNNAAQGTSLLNVADGALAQILSILQQQQSIANQAQSGSLTNTDRGYLNEEFQQLTNEINALATGTQFNGVNLIDGSIATGASNNPLQEVATSVDSSAGNSQPAKTNLVVTGQVAAGGITSTAVTLTDGNDSGGNTTQSDDTSFVGALSGGTFSVVDTAANTYAVSYSINGTTYQGTLANINALGGTTFTLKSAPVTTNGVTSGGSTLTFTVGNANLATADASYTDNAAGALAFQTDLTTAFAGATAFSLHSVADLNVTNAGGTSLPGSAIQTKDTNGTLLAGFDGRDVILQSSINTGGSNLAPVSSFSGTGSGSSTVLSVVVDGVTYQTAGAVGGSAAAVQTTTFNGITTNLGGTAVATGLVTFYQNGNTSSDNILQLNLNGIATSASIATSADVTDFVNALNTAFGTGGSAGGLTFQLGSTASANVSVNIANSQSSALFNGASLDVSTASDAATASAAITAAINTVTATRSQVGAYETQFNFASAALQSSVQNQSAAQSQLLDTNVATESTAYSTNQVKLQAGIAVLAQANQESQSLLKLLG